MINQDKWLSSLGKINSKFIDEANQLDHDRWINTIPKKNVYNNNVHYSARKYSLIAILFICGILFVSAVKNETRNLQKETNNLEASIKKIKFNLGQAILDYEVITSPENISKLAKEYLNIDFVSYKRSQIKNLNDKTKKFVNLSKIEKEETNKKTIKNLQTNVKLQIAKKINKKKMAIKKLQELYQAPKTIPKEIKTQVATQIKEKKNELKNIYSSPQDVITLKKVGKWSVVQVIKVFLGIPIVPGR